MPYTTLLSTRNLADHLSDPGWVVVDCRFSLADTARGRLAYQEAHVPGAVYAHLDEDLSAPHVPGVTGRHPLPPILDATATFSRMGIGHDTQVVAYDDAGGAIAARLWWMLRWLGHDAAAVLDGGFPAWRRAGLPTASGTEVNPPRPFTAAPRPRFSVEAADVANLPGDDALLDARAPARYAGRQEPIDPVAGHIPGAINAPFADNLTADGYFRPANELRDHYARLLTGRSAGSAVVYCGSGVTAAHDILAMTVAGLSGARLYADSWSGWITDPERPVAIADG